jgi:hypothetical protein
MWQADYIRTHAEDKCYSQQTGNVTKRNHSIKKWQTGRPRSGVTKRRKGETKKGVRPRSLLRATRERKANMSNNEGKRAQRPEGNQNNTKPDAEEQGTANGQALHAQENSQSRKGVSVPGNTYFQEAHIQVGLQTDTDVLLPNVESHRGPNCNRTTTTGLRAGDNVALYSDR